MYSLLQIAVSIVVDLGLDRLPEDVLEERPDLLLQDPSLRSNRSSLDQYFSTEARRAALGCLHLSAV
jgi:hypothetical protein